jgi:hypothetical protein
MSNVFVAPKIKVGFQERQGTFTGKLAYVIYYDEKGKLRKEKSWESWRDKKIEPEEFENVPTEGFTINKDIKRYNGEWFSSTRTMIRVHDPRGFEFEVTTENLIGILMHTNCLKRGLIGQFVYAWVGPELVLLPTTSEEYQKAVKYTSGLAKKVKAKDLVAGISYKTKRQGDVIFIGRFNWYEYKGKYYSKVGSRQESKVLVFTDNDGESFFYKTSVEFLSEPNSDVPVSNLAELVEKFNSHAYANKIVKYEFRPVDFDPSTEKKWDYYITPKRSTYFCLRDKNSKTYGEAGISVETGYEVNNETGKGTYVFKGFLLNNEGSTCLKEDTGEVLQNPRVSGWTSYQRNTSHSLEYMQSLKFFNLYIIFENGKEQCIQSLRELLH